MKWCVSFSPSGRYACRKGEVFNDYSRNFFHNIDFEEKTYIEVDAEGFKGFNIICLYWPDDNHMAVLYENWENSDREVMIRKKVLYEIEFEERKLNLLKIIEWKTTMTVFLNFCEGTRTLNGQEYLVFEDWGNTEVKSEFCLRLIPKGFDNLECVPEKFDIDFSDLFKAVQLDLEGSSLTGVVACKNTLQWTYNDYIQIISLNMDKYFSILKETGKPPAYADICSKIDIPMPKMIVMRSLVQNGFYYPISICKKFYGEDYLRVCNFETKQMSGLYKIEGVEDLDNTDEQRAFPRWYIHPSGNLVQLQTETVEFHSNKDSQNGKPFQTYRETHLIKFLTLEIIPSKVESMKIVTKEPVFSKRVKYLYSFPSLRMFSKKGEHLSLERESSSVPPVDTCKLPRCLREGRHLLSLLLQTNRSAEELRRYFG